MLIISHSCDVAVVGYRSTRRPQSQGTSLQVHAGASIVTTASMLPQSDQDSAIGTQASQAPADVPPLPAWLLERLPYENTLCGIGAQFDHLNGHLHQPSARVDRSQALPACPYHDRILDISTVQKQQEAQVSHTLSAYVNHNPSEQYALFYRSDTERTSARKGCICTYGKPSTASFLA